MIIYKVTNICNNKIYIGKSIRTLSIRRCEHYKNKKLYDGTHFHNALLRYPKNNFEWAVIYECNNENELNKKEEYFIELFNSANSDVGYNIFLGGTNYSIPNSTKQKQREIRIKQNRKFNFKIHKGKDHWNYGKITPEEVKNKIRETNHISNGGVKHPNYGKHLKQATIEKLKLINSPYIYCFVKDNIKYENIINIKDFCKKYDINFNGVLQAFCHKKSFYKDWKISRIKKYRNINVI